LTTLALAIDEKRWELAAVCLLLGVTEAAAALPPDAVEGLLEDDDLRTIELTLVENPWAGDTESGTGGVRKVRAPLKGKGKRGGARIVYLYDGNRDRIYFLLAWPKNQKASLTEAERKALRNLAKELRK
jgi:hypothetical protein